MNQPISLFVGLISGTSRDGVDAALVEFADESPTVLRCLCAPYPPELAAELSALLAAGRRPPAAALERLDGHLARHFSATALQLLNEADVAPDRVDAIGSHGQTVWHAPDDLHPESIQLGDPATIATQTGIVTVGDFRRADLEAGGQGAPLAPLLHRALFRPPDGRRAVLNLGGIANVSLLEADGSVSGFDTGPANCLLDAWIGHCLGRPFDRNGAWSASGRVDRALLKRLLSEPYLARKGPKSTGIEHFNLGWLRSRLQGSSLPVEDVQSTLAEFTAASVAAALRPLAPADLLVCGGGVHNHDLMRRLQAQLPDTPIRSTAKFNLEPDWVEAVLFAWLARERLAGRALDTRSITGARQPVLLGEIFDPATV